MSSLLNGLTLRIAVLVAGSFCSVAAFAHDTWLAPERYHQVSPGAVTLSLTSGMSFPELDYAIKPDRVGAAKARNALGETADVETTSEKEHALELTGTVGDGVTTFWATLHPRPSELEAEQVREYVDHLGLSNPEEVLAHWETKGAAGVNYRYIKYSKTFVRAGVAKENQVWSEATGMRLELVPETDPTRLTVGGTPRFLLLEEGKPLPRYPVSVIHDGGTRVYRTDAEGRLTIDVPAAGPYLVRGTTLVPSAVRDTEWDVHFTTLTFEAHEDPR